MGPSEDRPTTEKNQVKQPKTAGQTRRVRRPRTRACLLKGCERQFRPAHPLTRYCSKECQEEARRWREWKAQHHYRQSSGGKQKRREQSRRYRERCKQAKAAHRGSGDSCEGHRKKKYLAAPAIGRAAMRNSSGIDVRPYSDFVRTPAGAPWSGFWSANGAGGNGNQSGHGDLVPPSQRRIPRPRRAEMVLRYCASSGGLHKFSMPKQKRKGERSRAEV
jgi:hypothetical protein